MAIGEDWPVAKPHKVYLLQLVSEIRAAIKHGKTLEFAVEHVGCR